MDDHDERLTRHPSSKGIDVSERSRDEPWSDLVEFLSKVDVLVFLHYNQLTLTFKL